MSTPQTPKPRRRIAGESKPGHAAVTPDEVVDETPAAKPKLSKPKLPKRPAARAADNAEATAPSLTTDLPAAPARPEAVRVPRVKPSGRLIAATAMAVAAVAFGTFGVWSGITTWRSDNIAAGREAAADTAATSMETIFTYQYNELPQLLARSQKLMTPTFAKEYKDTGWKALTILAPQRKVQVKAVVRNAATMECGDKCREDRATVLVFIDQARVSADVPRPTVFGNRIKVDMVKLNGKWLVDDVTTV